MSIEIVPQNKIEKLVFASLLGGAIGDSLGAEIEFWDQSEILQRFPNGFDNLPAHQGIVGAITDDTQMTLFTAEGIIRSLAKGSFTCAEATQEVHSALLRWLTTQGYVPHIQVDTSTLSKDPRLQFQRAPGMTCLESLTEATILGVAASNNSKGCGTIMRIAPIAFCGAENIEELAIATSALTHGHPTGQQAAAAWALMLHGVQNGDSLEGASFRLRNYFHDEVSQAISMALQLPRDGDLEIVETMNGGGWTAEDALAIALYASLSAKSFEHGLEIAVMHSGDSDSTGAIAGNMLGLLFPDQVLAHRWTGQVECHDLICDMAAKLSANIAF